MVRGLLITVASLVFALSVLFTSVFRTSQPNYAFSGPQVKSAEATPTAAVDYYLPYPGILPDHILWPLKALRDRVWLFITRDPARRAELQLLFADKRVRMADELVRGGKAELGVSTATKAQKYLYQAYLDQEKARERGVDTGEFLEKLAKASLKHEEVLGGVIGVLPEDAKPVMNQTIGFVRDVYEMTVHRLNEKGRPVPTPPALEE